MAAVWIALIVASAAAVVLAAVAASGLGPMGSLKRSARRTAELREEIDSLRRGTDILKQRAEALRERRRGGRANVD